MVFTGRVVLEIYPLCPSAGLFPSQTCLKIEMEYLVCLKLSVGAVRNLLLSAKAFKHDNMLQAVLPWEVTVLRGCREGLQTR